MARRALFLVLLGGGLGAAIAGNAFAQAVGDPLRGLRAVRVSGGELSPEVAQAGFSVESLLVGLKERVGTFGLAVEAGPEAPRLVLDLHLFHLRAVGLYAFSVTLALEETVALERSPGGRVVARTWTASSVGTSLSGKLGEVLPAVTGRLAERFGDELALANPTQ